MGYESDESVGTPSRHLSRTVQTPRACLTNKILMYDLLKRSTVSLSVSLNHDWDTLNHDLDAPHLHFFRTLPRESSTDRHRQYCPRALQTWGVSQRTQASIFIPLAVEAPFFVV